MRCRPLKPSGHLPRDLRHPWKQSRSTQWWFYPPVQWCLSLSKKKRLGSDEVASYMEEIPSTAIRSSFTAIIGTVFRNYDAASNYVSPWKDEVILVIAMMPPPKESMHLSKLCCRLPKQLGKITLHNNDAALRSGLPLRNNTALCRFCVALYLSQRAVRPLKGCHPPKQLYELCSPAVVITMSSDYYALQSFLSPVIPLNFFRKQRVKCCSMCVVVVTFVL